MLDYHVLSVKQPWASLLLAGVKKYEVRSWAPRYVGYIVLHASSGKAAGMRERRDESMYRRAVKRARMEDEIAWPHSAIIGVLEVVKIWEPGDEITRATAMDRYLGGGEDDEIFYRWQIGRRWRLRSPIPCNGALNLWKLPRKAQQPIRMLRLPKERYRELAD